MTIRNVFGDGTKNTITIDNLKPESLNVPSIKSKVMEFNDNKGGTLSEKMKSANGFNWVAIDKVTITTTDRTYIF